MKLFKALLITIGGFIVLFWWVVLIPLTDNVNWLFAGMIYIGIVCITLVIRANIDLFE